MVSDVVGHVVEALDHQGHVDAVADPVESIVCPLGDGIGSRADRDAGGDSGGLGPFDHVSDSLFDGRMSWLSPVAERGGEVHRSKGQTGQAFDCHDLVDILDRFGLLDLHHHHDVLVRLVTNSIAFLRP